MRPAQIIRLRKYSGDRTYVFGGTLQQFAMGYDYPNATIDTVKMFC